MSRHPSPELAEIIDQRSSTQDEAAGMTHLDDSVFPVHLLLNCGSDDLARQATSLGLGLTAAHTTVQLRLDILILIVANLQAGKSD